MALLRSVRTASSSVLKPVALLSDGVGTLLTKVMYFVYTPFVALRAALSFCQLTDGFITKHKVNIDVKI